MDRIRIGAKLGYLKNREGERCPEGCGTKLQLSSRASFQRNTQVKEIKGIKINIESGCSYVCSRHGCDVSKHGLPVESSGGKKTLQLGGRGGAPAGEGLLCIWIGCQPWATHHPSSNDGSLLQGISRSSMQLYLDELRRKMAGFNIAEQKNNHLQERSGHRD